jgi:hypothetical protein
MPRKRCSCLIFWGGARFYYGGMTGRGGRSGRQNCVAMNFQSGDCQNPFLKVDGETIGGQNVEKGLKK